MDGLSRDLVKHCLGVSVRLFLDETDVGMGGLGGADGLSVVTGPLQPTEDLNGTERLRKGGFTCSA